MTVIDTYAYRVSLTESSQEDVYEYKEISSNLRVQVQFILESAIGDENYYNGYGLQNNEAWKFIRKTLCKEFGQLSLENKISPKEDCIKFLHQEKSVEKWLSLVELSMRYIEKICSKYPDYEREKIGIEQKAQDAIDELNVRFKRASFGYQYESGIIIKISDEFTHQEIIKPCLKSA